MCLFLGSACTLQAQEWPEVPARFVRVTSMSDVARAGFYAIGASDTDGHYLMRQTPAVNYDGKQTVAAAGEQRDAYSLSTSDNFWLIEPDGTDWTIKGEKGYLIPEGNNNFTLSSRPEPGGSLKMETVHSHSRRPARQTSASASQTGPARTTSVDSATPTHGPKFTSTAWKRNMHNCLLTKRASRFARRPKMASRP